MINFVEEHKGSSPSYSHTGRLATRLGLTVSFIDHGHLCSFYRPQNRFTFTILGSPFSSCKVLHNLTLRSTAFPFPHTPLKPQLLLVMPFHCSFRLQSPRKNLSLAQLTSLHMADMGTGSQNLHCCSFHNLWTDWAKDCCDKYAIYSNINRHRQVPAQGQMLWLER